MVKESVNLEFVEIYLEFVLEKHFLPQHIPLSPISFDYSIIPKSVILPLATTTILGVKKLFEKVVNVLMN